MTGIRLKPLRGQGKRLPQALISLNPPFRYVAPSPRGRCLAKLEDGMDHLAFVGLNDAVRLGQVYKFAQLSLGSDGPSR